MTESTSDGSSSFRRAMFATSAFTVEPATGGGGVEEITLSGTTREATTALRISRPLRASARTTVVTRRGGGSDGAPWSPKAGRARRPTFKQKFITLINPKQDADAS